MTTLRLTASYYDTATVAVWWLFKSIFVQMAILAWLLAWHYGDGHAIAAGITWAVYAMVTYPMDWGQR